MKWGLLALLPAVMLAGCAGTVDAPRFKTAEDFFGYMDGLKLNRMSMADASTRLTAEGYVCSPAGTGTTCLATEKLLTCRDKSSVTLAPRDKNQLAVKEKYSTLCI